MNKNVLRKALPIIIMSAQTRLFMIPPNACALKLYKYIHEYASGVDQSCLAYGFKEEKTAIDFDGREHKRLNGKSITEFEEPEVLDGIPKFFVWESDCIIGTKEKGQVIFNIIERHTHMDLSFLLESKAAACVNEVVYGLYEAPPDDFNTVFGAFIPDNGTEFCKLNNLPEIEGKIYFARPYTPTDKPQVKRFNRQQRQFFPKGESMEDLCPAEVYTVVTVLNDKPVKSLNWILQEMST